MLHTICELFVNGAGYTEALMLVVRVAVGVFFAISGYHKLFNADRHAALVATLRENGIPLLRFNSWFVPSVEFVGGIALVLGAFTLPVAAMLAVLLGVACMTDGAKRVEAFRPIDFADRIDDWLYLCETVYLLVLVLLIAFGPGPYSVDSFIWR